MPPRKKADQPAPASPEDTVRNQAKVIDQLIAEKAALETEIENLKAAATAKQAERDQAGLVFTSSFTARENMWRIVSRIWFSPNMEEIAKIDSILQELVHQRAKVTTRCGQVVHVTTHQHAAQWIIQNIEVEGRV